MTKNGQIQNPKLALSSRNKTFSVQFRSSIGSAWEPGNHGFASSSILELQFTLPWNPSQHRHMEKISRFCQHTATKLNEPMPWSSSDPNSISQSGPGYTSLVHIPASNHSFNGRLNQGKKRRKEKKKVSWYQQNTGKLFVSAHCFLSTRHSFPFFPTKLSAHVGRGLSSILQLLLRNTFVWTDLALQKAAKTGQKHRPEFWPPRNELSSGRIRTYLPRSSLAKAECWFTRHLAAVLAWSAAHQHRYVMPGKQSKTYQENNRDTLSQPSVTPC